MTALFAETIASITIYRQSHGGGAVDLSAREERRKRISLNNTVRTYAY